MKFLLDTNVCIAAFRGHAGVRNAVTSQHPDDIYICSPVIAELYVGAYKSAQKRKNVLLIEELMRDYDCPYFTVKESLKFAELAVNLAAQGETATVFDLQIASIAVSHGLTVVTHDVGDFGRIPGVVLEDWHS